MCTYLPSSSQNCNSYGVCFLSVDNHSSIIRYPFTFSILRTYSRDNSAVLIRSSLVLRGKCPDVKFSPRHTEALMEKSCNESVPRTSYYSSVSLILKKSNTRNAGHSYKVSEGEKQCTRN